MDIKKEFEAEVLKFYSKTDIKNGYILTSNRMGETEKFPLITLTCVVVNNKTHNFGNVFNLTETLANLKKIAKQKIKL